MSASKKPNLNRDMAALFGKRYHLILLSAVEKGIRFGYNIIEYFNEKTHGTFSVKSNATIYNNLHYLEEEGLIVSHAEEQDSKGAKRVVYDLTEAGHKRLEEEKQQWRYLRTIGDELIDRERFDWDNEEPPFSADDLKPITPRNRTSSSPSDASAEATGSDESDGDEEFSEADSDRSKISASTEQTAQSVRSDIPNPSVSDSAVVPPFVANDKSVSDVSEEVASFVDVSPVDVPPLPVPPVVLAPVTVPPTDVPVIAEPVPVSPKEVPSVDIPVTVEPVAASFEDAPSAPLANRDGLPEEEDFLPAPWVVPSAVSASEETAEKPSESEERDELATFYFPDFGEESLPSFGDVYTQSPSFPPLFSDPFVDFGRGGEKQDDSSQSDETPFVLPTAVEVIPDSDGETERSAVGEDFVAAEEEPTVTREEVFSEETASTVPKFTHIPPVETKIIPPPPTFSPQSPVPSPLVQTASASFESEADSVSVPQTGSIYDRPRSSATSSKDLLERLMGNGRNGEKKYRHPSDIHIKLSDGVPYADTFQSFSVDENEDEFMRSFREVLQKDGFMLNTFNPTKKLNHVRYMYLTKILRDVWALSFAYLSFLLIAVHFSSLFSLSKAASYALFGLGSLPAIGSLIAWFTKPRLTCKVTHPVKRWVTFSVLTAAVVSIVSVAVLLFLPNGLSLTDTEIFTPFLLSTYFPFAAAVYGGLLKIGKYNPKE